MNGAVQFLAQHGYWLLASAGLERQVCLPAPANVLLLAAGVLARTGKLSMDRSAVQLLRMQGLVALARDTDRSGRTPALALRWHCGRRGSRTFDPLAGSKHGAIAAFPLLRSPTCTHSGWAHLNLASLDVATLDAGSSSLIECLERER
jgi:hypothetical protein